MLASFCPHFHLLFSVKHTFSNLHFSLYIPKIPTANLISHSQLSLCPNYIIKDVHIWCMCGPFKLKKPLFHHSNEGNTNLWAVQNPLSNLHLNIKQSNITTKLRPPIQSLIHYYNNQHQLVLIQNCVVMFITATRNLCNSKKVSIM